MQTDTHKWVKGQWPNAICSGFITYGPGQYGGYVFRDASHGIPVLGHVTPNDLVLDGARVVYHGSYPDQAEQIARRLTAAWNAAVGISTEELETRAAALAQSE
jgi:hypothetical protein